MKTFENTDDSRSIATHAFERGRLFIVDAYRETEALTWNPHPTFEGVRLKHLITGDQTGGRLSCHLVRVEPGCEIGTHNHVGLSELHEVIAGEGRCVLAGKPLDYLCGTVALMPADMSHKVTAGDSGLLLFAIFYPALV
jgi:quercetin dioxygenase-like cupin family protein